MAEDYDTKAEVLVRQTMRKRLMQEGRLETDDEVIRALRVAVELSGIDAESWIDQAIRNKLILDGHMEAPPALKRVIMAHMARNGNVPQNPV
jgi:hypothetical protein